MALNNVTIIQGQGGLGRPATGQDFISGLAFWSDTLPSGFTTTNNIKNVLSLAAAEALGITNTYSDETKATGSVVITNAGATGDTIAINIAEWRGAVTICNYTRTSAATTATLVATDIAAAINSGTATHGYTATSSTATVTITARTGTGIYLNSGTPISTVIVGTIARTITQFSGGVASLLAQWHYHISEYFRLNPTGNLYVGFFPLAALSSSGYSFTELTTMQNYASGKIRQIGCYLPVKYPSSLTALTFITTCAGAANGVAVTNKANHQPFVVVLATNIVGVTDLTTLPDLSTLTYENVAVTVGQDGNNAGYDLYKADGTSISNLGAVLGTISSAKVSDSIAWVAQYNQTNGVELSTPAFSNGGTYDVTIATSLNSSKYLCLRTFNNVSGTYINDDFVANLPTSNYAHISDERTVQKIARLVYAAYVPLLNSPLQLNSDGTLANTTVSYLTGVGDTALADMIRNAEISAEKTVIDPAQNVLATSNLLVTVLYVQEGVARNITITLQPTTSI
jgi:Protein of unknown function (DUF2586)